MKKGFQVALLFLGSHLFTGCNAQQTDNSGKSTPATKKKVGGNFENSEFTYYGIPKQVSPIDTSAAWSQDGQKILLTGTVYLVDGKTPAPGVLLYYYQTNTGGRYLHKPEVQRSMPPNELGQTHGYIRGWVKTGKDGKYFIYTVRPGSYPTSEEPAHVHVTVKEPNELNEYYIDDFLFEDDTFLTPAKRNRLQQRAGSGIVTMNEKNGILTGERNIILGLNIPDYEK